MYGFFRATEQTPKEEATDAADPKQTVAASSTGAAIPLSLPVKGGEEGERMFLLQNKRDAKGTAVGTVSTADFHLIEQGEYNDAATSIHKPPAKPHASAKGKKGKRVPRNPSMDDWVVLTPTKTAPEQ